MCELVNKFLQVFNVLTVKQPQTGYLDAILTAYSVLEPSSASANVRSRVLCSISVLCVFCDACMPCTSSSTLALCVIMSQYMVSLPGGYSSSSVYTRCPTGGQSHALYRAVDDSSVCRIEHGLPDSHPAKSVFYWDAFQSQCGPIVPTLAWCLDECPVCICSSASYCIYGPNGSCVEKNWPRSFFGLPKWVYRGKKLLRKKLW